MLLPGHREYFGEKATEHPKRKAVPEGKLSSVWGHTRSDLTRTETGMGPLERQNDSKDGTRGKGELARKAGSK